ncbi:MAG: hypothetical protein CBARDCOR_0909 [uncultured Caballeronia sp.]|nr:MAG: hypothetical protein CBARDCOR_0909 [uncultured Caballeronia sp.]
MIAVLTATVLFARGAKEAHVSLARHLSSWFGLSAMRHWLRLLTQQRARAELVAA